MFGYIKPLAPELKVKEYELYKAAYCGLCVSMGKNISYASRLTLNYDMVFLVLVRILLTGEEIKIKPFRCKLKPYKKRALMVSDETMRYSASVAALLAYYKCIDNVNDTKNIFKRLLYRLYLPFLSHGKKKAEKLYNGLDEAVRIPLNLLSERESDPGSTLDSLASVSGKILANISSFGINDEGKAAVANVIGQNAGRWLYIIDALDDYDRDTKKGEYNIFSKLYKNKSELAADKDNLLVSLDLSLNEIDKAMMFLDGKTIKPIVENITRLGFSHIQEKVVKKLNGSKCND